MRAGDDRRAGARGIFALVPTVARDRRRDAEGRSRTRARARREPARRAALGCAVAAVRLNGPARQRVPGAGLLRDRCGGSGRASGGFHSSVWPRTDRAGETGPARQDTSAPQGNPAGPDRPAATRSLSAYAVPLKAITIDGRLDDWPAGLTHYPIRRQLTNHWSYEETKAEEASDLDAYFMAGYSEREQAIFLAVVVRDDELKVHANTPAGPADGNYSTVFETDAVEVYLDGAFSKRKISEPTEGLEGLDAATMPVLQFVAVPGSTGAYGDREGANPALVYRKKPEQPCPDGVSPGRR